LFTLFTTCKPFVGLDGIHQRNAIRSWVALTARPEIILIGTDPGVADVCQEFGLRHLPDIALNAQGRIDVGEMFHHAQSAARFDVLAYVNADICLFDDFSDALTALHWRLRRFMMCGQRHNLDVPAPVTEYAALRAQAIARADLLAPTGTDYFAFTKGVVNGLTAGLGVGHLAWDNYIPWYAVTHDHAAFVDATRAVTVVHQNHPAPNYNGHPGAEHNHGLVRLQDPSHPGHYCGLFLKDASHWLTPDGLRPKVSIVLPSMNRAERLERCVRRILDVTPYEPVEIIVVIDVDTDSRDRIEALDDPRVTVLFNEQRRGAVACWNQGLAVARGDILAFYNDDCSPEPGWLEAALIAHQEHLAEYGMVGFNDGYQDGDVLAVQYLFDRAFCVDHLGGVMAYRPYEFAWNDTEAHARAKRAGRFYWCREAVVQHEHWSRNGGQMDDLNRENMAMQGRDGYVFNARQAAGFPNDFEAVIKW
jgi:hypothetical protein